MGIRQLPRAPSGGGRARGTWGHSGRLGQARECPWKEARWGHSLALSLDFVT